MMNEKNFFVPFSKKVSYKIYKPIHPQPTSNHIVPLIGCMHQIAQCLLLVLFCISLQAIINAFIVLGESLHATQPEAPTAMGHTYSMWGSGERSLHLYGWRGREVRTCGSPPVQDRYCCASVGKCDSNRY